MVHIKIKKGLDIPIGGKPTGDIQVLKLNEKAFNRPKEIALSVDEFRDLRFRILRKVGDSVKRGQPLLEDKECPGRFFVAPAGGIIKELKRGLKRRLTDVVIEVEPHEEIEKYTSVDLTTISRADLIERFKTTGLFTHIRQRPFNFLANPNKTPRQIFVKAVESAPLVPPAELQVVGYEKEFQMGLNALTHLTDGKIHLVYRHNTQCPAFREAKNVEHHTVEGPHPIANASIHIQAISPIRSAEDVVWVLNAHDVISIGYSLIHQNYFIDRVISIAGPAIKENSTGYFKVREGIPITDLISDRLNEGSVRLISGDVLTGRQVDAEDFLGFNDYCFCAIPESQAREFLHFFRLGTDKYTATGTYLSGHAHHSKRDYDFTTHQHGDLRAFIDMELYEHVMPLPVPAAYLIKALMAEDYDNAVELGLLEVDGEDFALPTFICPSKIDMVDIVNKGLKRYAADVLK